MFVVINGGYVNNLVGIFFIDFWDLFLYCVICFNFLIEVIVVNIYLVWMCVGILDWINSVVLFGSIFEVRYIVVNCFVCLCNFKWSCGIVIVCWSMI